MTRQYKHLQGCLILDVYGYVMLYSIVYHEITFINLILFIVTFVYIVSFMYLM